MRTGLRCTIGLSTAKNITRCVIWWELTDVHKIISIELHELVWSFFICHCHLWLGFHSFSILRSPFSIIAFDKPFFHCKFINLALEHAIFHCPFAILSWECARFHSPLSIVRWGKLNFELIRRSSFSPQTAPSFIMHCLFSAESKGT